MTTAVRGYLSEPSVLRDEIYQSNVLLQAQKKFDLLGMRLFLIALSGINPHFSSRDKYYDEKFKMVFVPTAKLTELLGSSKYLAMLQKACVKLELVDILLKDDGDRDSKLTNIFQHVDYRAREGLYVLFKDEMRPYLLDLLYAKKGYTKVNVNYLLKLTSLYAIRLLEIILQYQNIPHYKNMMEIERRVSVKQLRFMLNVPEKAYKGRIDNFRKHVLDIPIKEINQHTPYFLRYKVIKKGTKTIAFKFIMATHNVPYKIAGKKPQFSNDAIDELRALGFDDGSARAIYNCCNGVDDCLLRLRRATTLLRVQEKNVKNRLGFLRRSIEQDWHSSTMLEKEDPYSKPGWSATMKFYSRRPGVPARGPNKQVDRPPNYLPSDKMDKQLADAITQGEFYTCAEDKTQSKAPVKSEPPETVAEVTAEKASLKASSKSEPSAEPKKIERAIKFTPLSETESAPPPPPKVESYYEANIDKLNELNSRCCDNPEEYQRVREQDFEEEMRELAEKKAREREEFVRKRNERLQAMGINISSNNNSGEWISLGDVAVNCIAPYISPEKQAEIRELIARAKKGFSSEPAPQKKIERAIKFTPPPTPNGNAAEPPATPKIEQATDSPQPSANDAVSLAQLSKVEIAAAGISKLLQIYKEISARVESMEEESKLSYEEGLKLRNEKRALEQELIAKGELSPPPPPPIPERIVNISLPPPPPPDFEKNTYRCSKKEKLIRKGIAELVQLYKEANNLNEEPVHILTRTNTDDVKAFKTEYDPTTGHDYVYLTDKPNSRWSLAMVDDMLRYREIWERWRSSLDFFADYKLTLVEVMRKYIKTYGYLPPRYIIPPGKKHNFKENSADIYTGKFEWTSDVAEPTPTDRPAKK